MGINEETRVLFSDKQLLAYICGSDRAVAGRINRFATFPAVSYDTVKGNIPMNRYAVAQKDEKFNRPESLTRQGATT